MTAGRLLALAALLVLGSPPAGAATRFETSRTLDLGPGRVVRTFTLHERSGVILLNRLTVPHGVAAVASATIPHVAGVRVSTRPNSVNPTPCTRAGPRDVCVQGEEWCPMPRAVWHVRLVKLGGPAGPVRFDLVIGPPPHGA